MLTTKLLNVNHGYNILFILANLKWSNESNGHSFPYDGILIFKVSFSNGLEPQINHHVLCNIFFEKKLKL
jgi:hypothetical protein